MTLPAPFADLARDERGVPILTPGATRRFRALVRAHFRDHGRPFPWRQTRDPYRILVSELMLQQTQTERVAAKYPAFLETFPTIESLAAAATPELLRAWRGLGYNRRALALRETARRVVAEHDGQVPRDPQLLATLPGIGAATAAEIAAFAYDVPGVVIETNIRRVYLYFFFPGLDGVADRLIRPLVERTLDRRRPRAWYYALMDYGVMLRKALPAPRADPNRRSAHYSRQPRFEGSDRQIRGLVVRILADGAALTPAELGRRVAALRDGAGGPYRGRGVERRRLARILGRLAEEGFVAVSGGMVRVP